MEPERLPDENLLLARQVLRRDLERHLRFPLDLVIDPGRTRAFMREAREARWPL